jgi:sodium/potassium-transporting ATPase subunit alpha
MSRPPRNMKKDRLVDWKLLRYSYFIMGILETVTCLGAYFLVFAIHGIPASVVGFSDRTYFQAGAPLLTVGSRTFSADEQIDILYEAHAAYYLNLVFCQIAYVYCPRVLMCNVPNLVFVCIAIAASISATLV